MDRRTVLRRAGVVGGVAALGAVAAPSALADEDEQSTSLVGGWIGTTDAGPPFGPFKALYTFARGGGLVTSSSIDLSPRSLSTPGYGTWTKTGQRTFAFTFDAFVFDQQGNPAGTVEARPTVTLDKAGETFSGPFKFDFIAPNGAIVFSGSGTHEASRIRVKPL
jgi:hypothetical protein